LEDTLIVRTKPANYSLAEQGYSTSITNVMGIKTEQKQFLLPAVALLSNFDHNDFQPNSKHP
jgi:hypothetical protein